MLPEITSRIQKFQLQNQTFYSLVALISNGALVGRVTRFSEAISMKNEASKLS